VRIGAALLILTGSLATAVAGADPALLGLVMPDAKAVSGINVDQAKRSPFGSLVLARIEADADLDQLAEVTGFDPRRDIAEIVAAKAADGSELALIRGTFHPERIAAVTGAPVPTYRGFKIVPGKAAHPGESLAILDESTVILGDAKAVQAAIDRRIMKSQFSGTLAPRIAEVSSRHAWFVTAISPADVPSVDLPRDNPMRSVQQFSGGLTFGDTTVTLDAEALTASPEDARSLVEMLKYIGGKEGFKLLNAAQFIGDGPILKFRVSLPEAEAEQLLLSPSRLKIG
jgi:hypothetical protein